MRWTLAIVPFLLAGTVQAADSPPAAAPEADHAAMKAHGEERWKAADKDGNGSLSRAEADASMPHLAKKIRPGRRQSRWAGQS